MTPDDAARVALLRAGKVDFVHTTGLLAGEEAIPLQQTNPELKVFKYQTLNWGMFYMRTDQPPFNDVRVRRALSLAINRSAWLETLDFSEGCLDHRAHSVCPARVEAGCEGAGPAQGEISGADSIVRKPSGCWLRPVSRKASRPPCIIIRAIRPPGPRATNWPWMS